MGSRAARVLRGPRQLATTPGTVRYRDVHYVYVLRSAKDGKLYTGYTADLRQRVADHVAGRASSTHDRRPMELIYYEAYLLAADAKAREIFLKSGPGKRFIRKQLRYYFSSLK